MKLITYIKIPFVIIYIRYIQYRYKFITINKPQSNNYLAQAILLQAKEKYYKKQFDSWGLYHSKFSYTSDEYKRHKEFLRWLFPEKDFQEWEIVIWHKDEAVTYYQNKIYRLTKGQPPYYSHEIIDQIRKWNDN